MSGTLGQGLVTVGSHAGADYTTLRDAIFAILAGGLTGDLTMVVAGEQTISTGVAQAVALNGHNLKIMSASRMKGKPSAGFKATLTYAGEALYMALSDSTGNGSLIVEGLYFHRGSSGGTGNAIMRITNPFGAVAQGPEVIIRDCVFDGNDLAGAGLRLGENGLKVQVHDCAFLNFSQSSSDYGLQTEIVTASLQPAIVENCVVKSCFRGLYRLTGAQTIYRNNVLVGCTNGISAIASGDYDDQSDGNVYSDSSPPSWLTAAYNRYEPDVLSEFISTTVTHKDFLVPVSGSYLYKSGVAALGADNTTSVEGSARPGSWHSLASGMVERREELRQHWNAVHKVTIAGEKLTASGVDIPICITQKAPGMSGVIQASRADGGDIRVTADRWGSLELPIEVAQWDQDSGACMVWVLPQLVTAGEDLDLFVWYGNPNAAEIPQSHVKGSWAVWADFNLVLHCMEDPLVDGFVKDSSPKKHFGVWTNEVATTHQAGLPGGGTIGKSYRIRQAAETTRITFAPGDFVNDDYYVSCSAWVLVTNSQGGVLLEVQDDASGNRLTWLIDSAPTQAVEVTTPDYGVTSYSFGGAPLPLSSQRFIGIMLDMSVDPEEVTYFVEGAEDSTDTLSDASGPFGTADSGLVRIGTQGATYFYGRLQEMWLSPTLKRADFQKLQHDNLDDGDNFYKLPIVSAQSGSRDLTFSTEEGEVKLEATDYYITYSEDDLGNLILVLNGVWEATGIGIDYGISRRLAIEERLRELTRMKGLLGSLTLGPDSPQTFADAVLTGLSVSEDSNNVAIIYDLTFDLASDFRLSRAIRFAGRRLAAGDFFVEWSAEDRTVFKDVFRSAPIRIDSGPPLQSISITSMLAVVGTGETALATRQRQERFLREWAEDVVGTQGELEIDGESYGIAHLISVEPSDLRLPGRVGISLQFATGYGS